MDNLFEYWKRQVDLPCSDSAATSSDGKDSDGSKDDDDDDDDDDDGLHKCFVD